MPISQPPFYLMQQFSIARKRSIRLLSNFHRLADNFNWKYEACKKCSWVRDESKFEWDKKHFWSSFDIINFDYRKFSELCLFIKSGRGLHLVGNFDQMQLSRNIWKEKQVMYDPISLKLMICKICPISVENSLEPLS